MADDLFKDCDCPDCGDCDCPDCGDCDCDCFDCDCNCDDCLPGNNVVVICCCIPPARNNDANRATRDASPDCCCCCERRRYSPRRRRRNRRNNRNKKGFCCWRLWWCFGRKDPSPPPSPPRPGPDELPPRGYMRDGRYPMPEDLDFYMNDDRWDRHHELDMPSRGYKSGGRYPMHGEMRMYRDEYDPRGGKWNETKETRKDYRSGGRYGFREEERDARSKDYSNRRDRWGGTTSRDLKDDKKKMGMNEPGAPSADYREHDRSAKREELGKAAKDEKKDEESTSVVQDVPPTYHPGRDHRQDKPDELEIAPHDYGRYDSYSSQGGLDIPSMHHTQGAIASGYEELDMPRGDNPRRNKPYDDDKNEMPHKDRGFKGIWSEPSKYEEPGRQTKH